MYTFWDYMRNRWPRDAGLRIDHLLLSAESAERLVGAGVDRDVRGKEGASDHAPAWVGAARPDEGAAQVCARQAPQAARRRETRAGASAEAGPRDRCW